VRCSSYTPSKFKREGALSGVVYITIKKDSQVDYSKGRTKELSQLTMIVGERIPIFHSLATVDYSLRGRPVALDHAQSRQAIVK